MDSVRRWWQELAALILPADCAGCGRARVMLCPACRTALAGAEPRRVRPEPAPPGLPAVHAAARYADEVRAVLLAHKERGALALARPLGEALAGAVRVGLGEVGVGEVGVGEVGVGEGAPPLGHLGHVGQVGHLRNEGHPGHGHPGHLLLVPVPSAPRAVRARGHDPARRIALAAAVVLRREGMPVRVAPVLRQRRAVADQAGLTSRQRMDNLGGALAVVPGGARLLRGGSVVLVDDLVTTGASLAEAARAVRSAVSADRAGEMPAGVADRSAFRGGAVYRDVGREGSGVRGVGVREGGVGRGGGELLFAAVVAASPDSPEINRN
ncbi:ComF family protein [Streptomyces sp. NPDC088254]|uniref:ComF family protein n=1 Tax=Streptomyces sp. NPDC088254 TaxID=3365847 RepID=UPI00381B3F5F